MTVEQLKDLEQVNQLSLSDSEREKMLLIFDKMSETEKILGEYDTENIDIMVHVLPMTNVLRADERKQPFSRESLLECGAEHTEEAWQVPRLVK